MASKGFRSVRARSMAIAIATALAASMARAETISVPPCGSTPGTTTGSYSGLAIVTVSGSLVITPDNPDQDAFFNFNESSSFTRSAPTPTRSASTASAKAPASADSRFASLRAPVE